MTEYLTRKVAAEDLKPGMRIADTTHVYDENDRITGTTTEVSVVERVEGPNHPDTGVGVYARREHPAPGISPTWSLGASYWDEFDVITREY